MLIPYGTQEGTPKVRFQIVTLLLVAVNVAVFMYQAFLLATYGEARLAGFLDAFAIVPADVTDGTPLEIGLLTSMFLHAGLLHILGNMLFLLPFGDNVEDRLGHVRYVVFYLACGLAASLLHIAVGPDSVIPAVGASGAIAGVLGGYLALFPGGIVKGFLFVWVLFTKIELPAMVFIGLWFVLQLFSGLMSLADPGESGGIAFWAHIGGFIAGLLLAPLLQLSRRSGYAD